MKPIYDELLHREVSLSEVLSNVGPGWHPLITKLIQDLFDMGWEGHIVQVKEKFGGLRFYVDGYTDPIRNRIAKAENDSFAICEQCGAPGGPRGGGWVKTLCEQCEAKRAHSDDSR